MAAVVKMTPAGNPIPTLVDIRNYFGLKTKEFADEWKALSDLSKEQIRFGMGDKTFDYVPTAEQITESRANTADFVGAAA